MPDQNTGWDMKTPQAPDRSYGRLVSGHNEPYTSKAQALSALTPEYRYKGKTALIYDGVEYFECWFKGGVADSDFVKKQGDTLEITIGDAADLSYTVSVDQTTLTVPGLIGMNVKNLFLGNLNVSLKLTPYGYTYGNYNIATGAISLTNGTFAPGAPVRIDYR